MGEALVRHACIISIKWTGFFVLGETHVIVTPCRRGDLKPHLDVVACFRIRRGKKIRKKKRKKDRHRWAFGFKRQNDAEYICARLRALPAPQPHICPIGEKPPDSIPCQKKIALNENNPPGRRMLSERYTATVHLPRRSSEPFRLGIPHAAGALHRLSPRHGVRLSPRRDAGPHAAPFLPVPRPARFSIPAIRLHAAMPLCEPRPRRPGRDPAREAGLRCGRRRRRRGARQRVHRPTGYRDACLRRLDGRLRRQALVRRVLVVSAACPVFSFSSSEVPREQGYET